MMAYWEFIRQLGSSDARENELLCNVFSCSKIHSLSVEVWGFLFEIFIKLPKLFLWGGEYHSPFFLFLRIAVCYIGLKNKPG